ncbi:MAG: GNAT family N-acetyltransferase [Candidatus Eisenbacteria bacterium]|nr:GNAT family N-acetyltransferase [Candidatus Eisenbacteria bacterium]
MLEFREFDDLGDPDLVSEWDALEDSGACPSPFATRVWIDVWAREFARDATAVVTVARSGGRAVALAPLFEREDRAELAVNFLSPRGEFLLGDVDTAPFARHVLGRFREKGKELVLRSVPTRSRTRNEIEDAAAGVGYLVNETESRKSPYIRITGSWEDYKETRTTKRLARWRKRVRKIEKIEGMEVRRLEGPVDVDALVEGFIEVERRSWKETRGTSISGRGLEEFYRVLCRALDERGWFYPIWLERGGEMFAFLLAVLHGGALYALKTSYDERYREFSPGTPLFYYAVTDAFEKGLKMVDFLGESSRWKSEWATDHREHSNLHLYPSGVTGAVKYLKEKRVKPIAKKILRGE